MCLEKLTISLRCNLMVCPWDADAQYEPRKWWLRAELCHLDDFVFPFTVNKYLMLTNMADFYTCLLESQCSPPSTPDAPLQ